MTDFVICMGKTLLSSGILSADILPSRKMSIGVVATIAAFLFSFSQSYADCEGSHYSDSGNHCCRSISKKVDFS